MKYISSVIAAVLILAGLILLWGSVYIIPETKQVIITEFGKPIGEPIKDAGLNWKKPFIHKVNYIEKRVLQWDDKPTKMPTANKTYIIVDTFGRWQINDATKYFERLQNERRATSRLDDLLGSEIRTAIAKHELIEVIRSTKDRKPERDASLVEGPGKLGQLYPISVGRTKIEEEIFTKAAAKLNDIGIELLDIRFKRINYNEDDSKRIFERMISERQQIAQRFLSEGAGEAAKIKGSKERDLQEIQSEAYRVVQTIKGKADARATEIYAQAYNQGQAATELYGFLKSMQSYRAIINEDTTLILTTDGDLYQYLQNIDGK